MFAISWRFQHCSFVLFICVGLQLFPKKCWSTLTTNLLNIGLIFILWAWLYFLCINNINYTGCFLLWFAAFPSNYIKWFIPISRFGCLGISFNVFDDPFTLLHFNHGFNRFEFICCGHEFRVELFLLNFLLCIIIHFLDLAFLFWVIAWRFSWINFSRLLFTLRCCGHTLLTRDNFKLCLFGFDLIVECFHIFINWIFYIIIHKCMYLIIYRYIIIFTNNIFYFCCCKFLHIRML